MRRLLCATMVVAGVVLAACAVQAPRPPESKAQQPPGFPDAFYQPSGRVVFAIDPALSLVVIEVRRGGSLAKVGHDHAIASHNVRGYIAPDEGCADLFIRLDELVVDEPALRAQAAFDTQPTEAAITGTRENMFMQLQVMEHPFAVISVAGVENDAAGTWLQASIALRGVTRTVRIPVQIEQSPDRLSVTGRMQIEQSSFGIAPMSILGGALVVQDRVNVRFQIEARRAPS